MHLTRSHIYALWEQKVGGCEGDSVLVVYKVLSVLCGRCADEHDCLAVAGQCVDCGESVVSRVDRCNSDVACARSVERDICQRNELEQRASAFTGLWVDLEAVSYSEHVPSFDDSSVTSTSDGDGCCTFSGDSSRSRTASCSTRTSGELLDGLRHIDFVETKYACTHHAVLELLADRVGWVEETLQTFDQASVSCWVDGGVAWRHYSSVFVQLLLCSKKNSRSSWCSAGRADRVTDGCKRVCNVSVDAGSKLRDTWLENALCEIVKLHGQFSRCEVDADVLLAGNGQRCELFVVILYLKGCAVSYKRTVWKTDTQGRANFSTFNSEAVVVLAVYVTCEYEVVLQNFQSLPRNHVNC